MAERDPPHRARLLPALLVALLAGSLALRLGSATDRPHPGRFFDERYTLENVESVLRGGGLRPANGFYLALSYLPQSALLAASESLHRWTGSPIFAIWDEDGKGFSPTSYVICRSLNALVAAAGLWLTFVIGRALWSAPAGLVAAAALAAAPRHLRCSVEFKPDIWVVTLGLLTFLWALDAARRPTARRFARAGSATGLALSAKYTAIGAALAVAVAGLAGGGWRHARRWAWLLLSGGAALLTYVVLNPYLGLILPYVPRVLAGYVRQSKRQGLGHGTLLLRELRFLADNLGWLVGILAVAGAILVVARLLRARRRRESMATGELMLIVQLVGYSLFYAFMTPLFRGQNYLPVVPLAALLAAFAAVTAAEAIVRCAPRLAVLRGVAAGAVVIGSLAAQAGHVYRDTVPTTWQTAGGTLVGALAPLEGRQIVVEPGEGAPVVLTRDRRPLIHVVRPLTAAPGGLLDGADAEVFPLSRLAASAAHRARWERTAATRRVEIVARPWRQRGEPVAVLLHPWQPVGSSGWQPLGHAERIALPAAAAGELVSVELAMRWKGTDPRRLTARLEAGGRELPLHGVGRSRGRLFVQSARFAPGESRALLVRAPPAARRSATWRIVRWRAVDAEGG